MIDGIPPAVVAEWRFRVVNPTTLQPTGQVLHPELPGLSVGWTATTGIQRMIRGWVLPADEDAVVDRPSVRVRAEVRVNGGGWVAMGVFMYGPTSLQIATGRRACGLMDLGLSVDQQFGRSVSAVRGTPIQTVLADLCALFPTLAGVIIDPAPSGQVLGEPLNWDPRQRGLAAINGLAQDNGYRGLTFDRVGTPEIRTAIDPALASTVQVDYDESGNVFVDSEFEDEDYATSADEWVAEVVAGQDTARVGRFLLPADDPRSRYRRGFASPRWETIQSAGTIPDADTAALSMALTDPQNWRSRRFTSWVDSGHDVFTVVKRGGLKWQDQSWQAVVQGSQMTHVIERTVTQ